MVTPASHILHEIDRCACRKLLLLSDSIKAMNSTSGRSESRREVSCPRRRAHIEERRAGHELVLYDPVAGRLHVLNLTAAQVWRLCDGDKTSGSIAERLAGDFQVDALTDPGLDVRRVLRTFMLAGLVEDNSDGSHAEARHHCGSEKVDGG